jgi:hypothetical protein
VGYLAAGVHAGVSAAGDGQGGGGGQGQDLVQGILYRLLDGALAALAGPAVEGCPVVGQVKPKPDERLTSPGIRVRRRLARLGL